MSKKSIVTWIIRLGLCTLILAAGLAAAEYYAYMFLVKSDGFGFTLASRRWEEKYWGPVNSFRYRDQEPSSERFREKKVLFVTGDSFIAGYGINRRQDRISDRLQARLGSDWAVANIAINGWTAWHKLQGLKTYPASPDIIVFSYYIDDIAHEADENGMPEPQLITLPHPVIRNLVERSYLANFMYWRMYRFRKSDNLEQGYWDYLNRCYTDTTVWGAHQNRLREIRDFAAAHQSKLVFVLFPYLPNAGYSVNIINQVEAYLQELKVPVINTAPLIAGYPVPDLVVNELDAHPSRFSNRLVAEEIENRLSAWGWLPPNSGKK